MFQQAAMSLPNGTRDNWQHRAGQVVHRSNIPAKPISRYYLPFEAGKITRDHVISQIGRDPKDENEVIKELKQMENEKSICKDWMADVLRWQIFHNACDVNMLNRQGDVVGHYREIGEVYMDAKETNVDKERLASQVHWAFYGWFSLQKDFHLWLEEKYLAYRNFVYKEDAKIGKNNNLMDSVGTAYGSTNGKETVRRKNKGYIGDICKAKRNELVNSFKRRCMKSVSRLYVKDSGHMEKDSKDPTKKVQSARREIGRFYVDYQVRKGMEEKKLPTKVSPHSVSQEQINDSRGVYFNRYLEERRKVTSAVTNAEHPQLGM